MLIYVDDCVILSNNEKDIAETMNMTRKIYTITDEGEMEKYLEIQLERSGNLIRMSQPLQIDRIIETVPGKKRQIL